jgi:hypothetical protein
MSKRCQSQSNKPCFNDYRGQAGVLWISPLPDPLSDYNKSGDGSEYFVVTG